MKFLSGQFSRLLDGIRNFISYDSNSIGVSRKRECEIGHWLDDSDDDFEFEPPPKRSRLATCSNTHSFKRTGSISGEQIFQSMSSAPISHSHLDYLTCKKNINEKENSIASGMNIIKDSVIGNKENFKKTSNDFDSKESEEVKFLGSSIKILRPTSYNIDSSFKFSPSLVTSEFRPTITSTVGREMNANLKMRQSEAFKKSNEILELKRTPLKAKRPSLFGKYINPTRLCFSNLKTTMQSFRLSEKKEYGKLLEQYTSTCQNFNRPMSSLQGTNGIKTALSISHLDPKYTLEKKKSFKNEKQNSANFPCEASSNNEYLRGSSFEIPLIDLEKEEERLRKNDDDEIFVTKHIKPKKCLPINSLEEKLLKCEYYRGDDLHNLKAEDLAKRNFYQESIKKIEEKSERRNKFFNNLHNVDRLSSSLSKLTTKYPVEYIEVSEEEDKLPELTKEIKIVINHAFKGGPHSQVLAEKFNIQITRKDICTLAGLNWLNDEIINFYMNMIVERSQREKCYPKVYAFNTFFYSKLISTGYGSVKRWTKKVDIFTHDLLIIPVHLGMHWCLAIIDFRSKAIQYYDSMLGNNYKCLEELRNYLENEHKDKKKSPYGTSLSTENVKDIPQQMNGSDCGMFSCKFAEYLSRNAPITFTQENMPYFRNRMVYEIYSQTLMAEPLKPYKY